MQRGSARCFALISLLWCVSGPSGVLFTAAPNHRSKSKHGNFVSGASALGQRPYRSHESVLTARVIAQLVEYQVPAGMESKLPITVAGEITEEKKRMVVAQLIDYKPPAGMVEMEDASGGGSGDGTAVALLIVLGIIVAAIAYIVSTKEKSDQAGAAPASAPAAAAASPPTAQSTPASAPTATETGPPQFAEGHRVSLLGPPKMVGKEGSIMGFIGDKTVAVQLESGSIFHFAIDNIQHAAAATPAPASPIQQEDVEFKAGQHVTILKPRGLAGKPGEIFKHAGDEIYAVIMSSGSIFHFPAGSLQDATPVRAF